MKKRIAAVLILLIVLSSFVYAPANAEKENGIIRVLITKINFSSGAHLTLDGVCTVNGTVFSSGSYIVIWPCEGHLLLSGNGFTMDLGREAVLTRHPISGNETCGVRFSPTGNLYPGDLRFSINGDALRCVISLSVEDYLNGVVPYEMNDSFPLEALKAQAVTARTYALRRKTEVAGSRDFDLYDNTNDQVYFGTDKSNTNAALAVKETEGLCGIYKGKYADCRYSASNGGQTELPSHVWNISDPAFAVQRDDPYDLANPSSVVRAFQLLKDAEHGNLPTSLASVMLEEIKAEVEKLGYSESDEDLSVHTITALSLEDPCYPGSESRIMKKLRISFTVSSRKLIGEDNEEEIWLFGNPEPTVTPQFPAAAPKPEKQLIDRVFTVDLPLYGAAENAFGLSINAKDNELFTVTETDNAFVIESRRYGHGVGMSQRGAQQMAASGCSFSDILSFYYPGLQFSKVSYTSSSPTPLPSLFCATPPAAATATPRPTLIPVSFTPAPGQYTVTVNKIDISSSLNLREEPALSSRILRVLYYGQKLCVTGENGEWLHVTCDGTEGWVMRSYVTAD